MIPAIFLDRDGVLNIEGYIGKKEQYHFLPGVIPALQRATAVGHPLIMITNQAGIAKGKFSKEDYLTLSAWLVNHLSEQGITLQAIYACPHHAKATVSEYARVCPARKPGTGMLEQAAKDFGIDLSQSYFIGDKTSDILAGKNAGCKTILVKTGYGGSDGAYEVEPDMTLDDLSAAIDHLLKHYLPLAASEIAVSKLAKTVELVFL